MNRRTKVGIAGAATAAMIGGAMLLSQRSKPIPKERWPVCVSSLGSPSQLAAIQGADGQWRAQFTARPPNAPCKLIFTAQARDDKGGVGVSKPVTIYIDK